MMMEEVGPPFAQMNQQADSLVTLSHNLCGLVYHIVCHQGRLYINPKSPIIFPCVFLKKINQTYHQVMFCVDENHWIGWSDWQGGWGLWVRLKEGRSNNDDCLIVELTPIVGSKAWWWLSFWCLWWTGQCELVGLGIWVYILWRDFTHLYLLPSLIPIICHFFYTSRF